MGVLDIVGSIGGQLAGNAMGAITGQNSMSDQVAYAKQMAIFNREQQMQLWRDTNYKAQADQMRKAGLNVGLMYGKGGGQGGSVAANTGQMPTGYSGNNSNPMDLASLVQMRLADAQIKKMNAETKVIETTGVKKAEAEISSLNANTGNAEADTLLKKVNTEIASIQKEVYEEAKPYSVFKIVADAEKAQGEARSAWVKANVDRATQETQINKLNAEYIEVLVRNDLNRSNIKLNEEQINKIKTDIETMQRNASTYENQQKAIEEFQDSLIKQGYWKLGSETILGIGNLVTRTPKITTTTGYSDKGGYFESTTTRK